MRVVVEGGSGGAQLLVDSLAWVDQELEAIDAAGLRRRLLPLESPPGPEVLLDGRPYLLLGSNNYLDLAAHPEVVAGARAALERFGAGAGASRLVSGANPLQAELEAEVARLVGAEGCLLFSSGYLANVSTIAALVGRGDAVFSDELNHASLIDGCRLSGARVVVYRHRDAQGLDVVMRQTEARRRLIVTDSIFSMEGDSAPLRELVGLADRHGAMLMLDESHAIGVLGETGGGLAQARGVSGRVPIVMGTLSKALGSAGGFIAGSTRLVELLRHRARGFIFDTAPAPAAVGAALAALRVLGREPARRARLLELTTRLRDGLSGAGMRVLAGEAAVVPLIVGEAGPAVGLASRLRNRGVIAPAIRPPSVPPGTSRLRLTVSSGFSEAQVDRAVEAITQASNQE